MNDEAVRNPFLVQRLNSASDFVPEWDIPSFNERVSRWFLSRIPSLKGRTGPDPGLRIGAVIATPGYGKTHLFGRLAHALRDEAVLIYVPHVPAELLRTPLEHIRWHTVEGLFESEPGRPTRIARALARLCAPSVLTYLNGLPPSWGTKVEPFRQRLEENPAVTSEMLPSVNELLPYCRLAESVADAFTDLPRDVVYALALGWSPAAQEVRRWLRGDNLPDEVVERLGVSPERPSAEVVVRAVAKLMQRVGHPVAILCDQLEAVLAEPTQGPFQLSVALMGLLQVVPNLLLAISCLEDRWEVLRKTADVAFERRVEVIKCDELSPELAVEMVARRLRTWPSARPDLGTTWPIKPDSIQAVARKARRPHDVLVACQKALDEWVAAGADGWTELSGGSVVRPPLEEQFLEYWQEQLQAIQAAARSPDDCQEAELYQAVREALEIAQAGSKLPAGLQCLHIQERAITHAAQDPRPSLSLRIGVGDKAFAVVAAVTKNEAGVRFGAYMDALEAALGGEVAGAVLVRPKSELAVGPRSQARKNYERLVDAKKLRVFPLNAERLDFDHLLCLLRVMQLAQRNELLICGRPLTPANCRGLVMRLGLLDNLKLFGCVFDDWPHVVQARAKAPATVGTATALPNVGKPGPASPPAVPVRPPDGSQQSPPSPPPPKTKPEPPPTADAYAWAKDLLARVVEKLRTWAMPVEPQKVEIGPTFVRLRVVPKGQTDVNKVRNKAEALRTHLEGVTSRPIIASQAGCISIDVQRPDRQVVGLATVMEDRPAKWHGFPAFPVGVDVANQPHWLNLAEPSQCHLLVAGTTGSGKSEFIKTILASLAHHLAPDQLQFLLIDPKKVTFNFRGSSPYLPRPIANDTAEARPAIEWCFREMERRYDLLKVRRLENISELKGKDVLPRIVLMIDEFADLLNDKASKKELETLLKRIGAKARAAGIHLILGTQRTEASVVTPLLRSNLPGRISLQVTSERDSKLILDAPDAAHLLGRGDLLWKQGGALLRLQSPFVTRSELEEVLRTV